MVKVVAPCIQMSSVAACGLLWLQLVWQLLRHTFLVLHPLLPQLDISCRGEQGQGEEAALLANILCFTWLGNGSLRNYVVLRMQAPPHTLVQPPSPSPPSCHAPASTPAPTPHPHCLLSLLLRSVFSILVFNMRCLKVCKVISCQPFCQPLTKCCCL